MELLFQFLNKKVTVDDVHGEVITYAVSDILRELKLNVPLFTVSRLRQNPILDYFPQPSTSLS